MSLAVWRSRSLSLCLAGQLMNPVPRGIVFIRSSPFYKSLCLTNSCPAQSLNHSSAPTVQEASCKGSRGSSDKPPGSCHVWRCRVWHPPGTSSNTPSDRARVCLCWPMLSGLVSHMGRWMFKPWHKNCKHVLSQGDLISKYFAAIDLSVL